MKKLKHALLVTLILLTFLTVGIAGSYFGSEYRAPEIVTISDRVQVIDGVVHMNWHAVQLSQYMEIITVLNYMKAHNLTQLELVLNNGGGNVIWMIGIYDMLEAAIADGLKLNTHVYGRAASAAVPIMLLGEKRTISKNSHIMLHPSSGIIPQLISQDVKDLHKSWNQMYAQMVADRTHMTFDEVLLSLQGSSKLDITIFSAKEALKLGFATE